jgi:hypothetical protein
MDDDQGKRPGTDEPSEGEHPWSVPPAEEPEPEWAQDIRVRRKARGDRLKERFDREERRR